jgi:hypothetical protein
MKILKAGDRTELLQKIRTELNSTAEEVYLNTRPSIQIIITLLNKAPSLKKVYVPPSLCKETPERIKKALNKIGVELIPFDKPRGRPRVRDEEVLNHMLKLAKEGETAGQIAYKTGIPLRTVYYYLKKARHNE